MVRHGGGEGEGGRPGGGAGVVGVVALLEGPDMFPLEPPGGVLPLRLDLADESPGQERGEVTAGDWESPVVDAPDGAGRPERSRPGFVLGLSGEDRVIGDTFACNRRVRRGERCWSVLGRWMTCFPW